MKLNSLDDVIEKDIKWLFHFLKEQHIIDSYFLKMNCQREKLNIKFHTIENVISNAKQYHDCYIYDLTNLYSKKYHILLKENNQLLNSMKLFATWRNPPYILADSGKIEHECWLKIRQDYSDLKELIINLFK